MDPEYGTHDDDEIDDDEIDDEQETSNESAVIRKLRRKLKDANKRAKERDDFKAENTTLRRERMIFDAGLGELSVKRRQALLAAHGDAEHSADALKATAVELGFAESEPDPEVEQARNAEMDAHADIGQAAQGAQPSASGVITADVAADWGQDKWVRFNREHPEHAEALMRGEQVAGISGY